MRNCKKLAQVVLLAAPFTNSWAEESQATDSVGLEKLVVTADLREQNSFDVPSSIQVVDGETIEELNYESPEELAKAIPNTNLTRYRAGLGESNFTIRGVGATTVNVDQSIGFYVDEIPVASVSEFGPELYDVEQFEILRGPQGTLYGRNALGGVFHIKTVQPQPEQSGKASVSYGSENDRRVFLLGNTPLGETENVLARFSFVHSARDPRIENLAAGASDVDDTEVTAGRAKLLFDVSDQLSLLFAADLSDSKLITGSADFNGDRTKVNSIRPAKLTKQSGGLSLKAEYLLDTTTLVSLTSIRMQDQKGGGSRAEAQSYDPLNPFTVPFNNDYNGELDQTTIIQELRLESATDERLSWILGGFYQYNKADRLSDLVNVSLNGFERSFATTKDSSVAAFADLTYELDERSSITAGLRLSHDRKELDYRHEGSLVPVLGFQAAPNQTLSLDDNFSDISPRLIYAFKPNQNINLFAKVAKSYKAGGYNTEFLKAGDNKPYQKESILSYEAGLKAVSEDGHLEVDVTAFYMDWSDQQVLDFSGLGLTSVVNAEESVSQGVELQLRATPAAGLLLTAAAGYVDAEFKQVSNELASINGNRQPNTSKVTASLGVRYQKALSHALEGYVAADLSYQSSFFWDVNNSVEEPSHTFLNLSAGAGNEDYRLSAYLKNATDEAYNTYATPGTPGFFTAQAQPGFGREFGLKWSLNF